MPTTPTVSPEDLIARGPTAAEPPKPPEPAPSTPESETPFNLDAFNEITNKAPEPAPEPTAPESKPTTPEVAAPETPAPAPTPEPAPQPTPQPQGRDYSGFSEQEVSLLKQMSNPAYEYTVARIKELRAAREQATKLEQQVNQKDPVESNLLHENAYVLDPEYATSQQLMSNATQLANFYQQQLIKIKRGEKWQDLETDGNGKLYTVEKEPSDESEEDLRSRISENQVIVQQTREKINNLATSFKKRQSERVSTIKSIEDAYFPFYADPKVANENKYIQEMRAKLAENGVQNNILSGIVAKLFATAMRLREVALAQDAELKKQQTAKKQAVAAGPTSGEMEQSTPTKAFTPDELPFDEEAFRKIKEGR